MFRLNLWARQGKIIVSRCCQKREDILREYTIDEWMSLPDIYKELAPLVNEYPTTNVNAWCDDGVEICYSKAPIPLRAIELGLEFHCNAKCTFCGAQKFFEVFHVFDNWENGIDVMPDVYFSTLEKLRGAPLEEGVLMTELGEPFFYKKRMIDFIQKSKEGDFKRLKFTTNAIAIDNNIINLMKEKDFINFDLSISLNAASPRRYYERMGVNKFGDVLETILKLKKLPNIGIGLTSVYDTPEENQKFLNLCEALEIHGHIIPLK